MKRRSFLMYLFLAATAGLAAIPGAGPAFALDDWGPLIDPLDEDALEALIAALLEGLKLRREALNKEKKAKETEDIAKGRKITRGGGAIDLIDRMIKELEAAQAAEGPFAKKTLVKHALATQDSIVNAINFLKAAIPLNPLSKYRFLIFLLKMALQHNKDKKKNAKLEELLKRIEEAEHTREKAEKSGDKVEQEKAEKEIERIQKEIEKEV